MVWDPERSFVAGSPNAEPFADCAGAASAPGTSGVGGVGHVGVAPSMYDGRSLRGVVRRTYVRGIKVFHDGGIVSGPVGRPLRFGDPPPVVAPATAAP